jgi:hypothetical protein
MVLVGGLRHNSIIDYITIRKIKFELIRNLTNIRLFTI